MTIPYTYYLINDVTKEKYYGVRYGKDCNPNDLWVTYFSSSKYVKRLIKLYGADSFNYEVRRTFDTAEEARNWEERVLRKLNVMKNASWLNKGICGKFLKEGPQSAEHKEKRLKRYREYLKLNPRKLSQKTKDKISKSLKGVAKPMTDEHIMALKCHTNNETKISCPHCNKTGQLTNMKHWHFDNCPTIKSKPQIICEYCLTICTSKQTYSRYHGEKCKLIPKVLEINSK